MSGQKRILLPQPIEKDAVDLLQSLGYEVNVSPDTDLDTVRPLLRNSQGIILRTGIKMTRELMEEGEDLQVISRTGAGVDNIDVQAATDMGILVTSVPGANTISVVEHTLSLILALMKYLPLMDREVRNDNFKVRYRNFPRELNGKALGVLGLGRIGSELARTCYHTFNMKILGYDPYLSKEQKEKIRQFVDFCEIQKVISESDVISIHIPLVSTTQNLIGEKELGWMKNDAFLVNTSRGGIIDENALIQSLKEKRIAGAGLDVFSMEPLGKDNPLKELSNVIMTPHSAALTQECVIRLAMGAAQCIRDVFQDRLPSGIVNPEVLSRSCWQHLK